MALLRFCFVPLTCCDDTPAVVLAVLLRSAVWRPRKNNRSVCTLLIRPLRNWPVVLMPPSIWHSPCHFSLYPSFIVSFYSLWIWYDRRNERLSHVPEISVSIFGWRESTSSLRASLWVGSPDKLLRSVSGQFGAKDEACVCFFDAKIVKDEQNSHHGNRYTRVPSPEFEHDNPLRPLFESPWLSLSLWTQLWLVSVAVVNAIWELLVVWASLRVLQLFTVHSAVILLIDHFHTFHISVYSAKLYHISHYTNTAIDTLP
jgi:hypothetical protein